MSRGLGRAQWAILAELAAEALGLSIFQLDDTRTVWTLRTHRPQGFGRVKVPSAVGTSSERSLRRATRSLRERGYVEISYVSTWVQLDIAGPHAVFSRRRVAAATLRADMPLHVTMPVALGSETWQHFEGLADSTFAAMRSATVISGEVNRGAAAARWKLEAGHLAAARRYHWNRLNQIPVDAPVGWVDKPTWLWWYIEVLAATGRLATLQAAYREASPWLASLYP